MNVHLSEIFVSYQGEGLFAGAKNLFIRFADCNLRCSYCDEKQKKSRNFPFSSVLDFVKKTLRMDKSIRIISLTGGEPLLYVDFLEFLTKSINNEYLILLETNSTLVENLKKVITKIDIISADIKLPQYCGYNFFELHREFLKISSKKIVYVKVVFDDDLIIKDFEKAVDIVSSVSKKIPFFIQPESKSFITKKYFDLVDRLYRLASKKLLDVRFLPQIHRYLDIK